MLELYDKVQSHADPAGWLAENRTVWGGWEGGFDDTPYAAELLAAIHEVAQLGPSFGLPLPDRGGRGAVLGHGRSLQVFGL